MRTHLRVAALLFFLFPVFSFDRSSQKLRVVSQQATNVPEPSDIVADPASGHLFIVSDNGVLHECDNTGRSLRKASQRGTDFEALELRNGILYVSDESERRIYTYRASDLSFLGMWPAPWPGARNSGFESLCWNETGNCFVLVSEKSPAVIIECDEQFHYGRQIPVPKYISDVSSARYFAGAVWLLSDEDRTIYRCDPKTYEVQARYTIPVLNPEGIAFSANGQILISADDLQRIYTFDAPGK